MHKLFDHIEKQNLLEKMTEAAPTTYASFVGKRNAGFIAPDGKTENLSADVHYNHAVKMLANVYNIKKISGNPIDMYLAKSGAVRYSLNGAELDISIVAPVTKSQLRTIFNMSTSVDVYFDMVKPTGQFLATGRGFSNLVQSLKKHSLIGITESSIDFPKNGLSALIWDRYNNTYKVKDNVKAKIQALLRKHPSNLLDIAKDIRIVGSLCSDTYADSADLDVHVVPKELSDWDEKKVKSVMNFFNDNRGKFNGFISSHPIEIYIQTNPSQDLMSDGCYDLLNDKWLTGPTLRGQDYNPYDDFKDIFDEVSSRVENADKLLGELKRDIIDYDTMKGALKRLDTNNKEKILVFLQDKLNEIEAGIESLYKERKNWSDARKFASKPATPEEALSDIELAKEWADENAIFKFIARYRYMKIIGDLHQMIADDVITDDEMNKMKKMLGI